jgi:hypothetical protein
MFGVMPVTLLRLVIAHDPHTCRAPTSQIFLRLRRPLQNHPFRTLTIKRLLSGLRMILFQPAVDLSRFDAAPLIAFTATKETDYGTETDGRIPTRCSADRADQWAYTQTGC